jgi:hypothetical protein
MDKIRAGIDLGGIFSLRPASAPLFRSIQTGSNSTGT